MKNIPKQEQSEADDEKIEDTNRSRCIIFAPLHGKKRKYPQKRNEQITWRNFESVNVQFNKELA